MPNLSEFRLLELELGYTRHLVVTLPMGQLVKRLVAQLVDFKSRLGLAILSGSVAILTTMLMVSKQPKLDLLSKKLVVVHI